MSRAPLIAARAIFLLGLAASFGGCAAVVESGGGGTAVYGDFGAAEPFDYGNPWYDGGGIYVHPPYGRRDEQRNDQRRPEPARGAPAHAAPRAAPSRPAPSIPTAPRPSAPSRGGGGGGKDDHKK